MSVLENWTPVTLKRDVEATGGWRNYEAGSVGMVQQHLNGDHYLVAFKFKPSLALVWGRDFQTVEEAEAKANEEPSTDKRTKFAKNLTMGDVVKNGVGEKFFVSAVRLSNFWGIEDLKDEDHMFVEGYRVEDRNFTQAFYKRGDEVEVFEK